jgi:hypothetical protein
MIISRSVLLRMGTFSGKLVDKIKIHFIQVTQKRALLKNKKKIEEMQQTKFY